MGEIYFNGLYSTRIIEGFLIGRVTEAQVDAIKESVSKFWEWMIDSSFLSTQEKEEQKRQMKQSADAYNHGIKDALRMVGD